MASIKLRMNKSRMHNDGTYALVFQIIHERRKRIICADVDLKEEEFDMKKERVRYIEGGTCSRHQVGKLNKELQMKKGILKKIEEELSYTRLEYSVDDIAQIYLNKDITQSLYFYIDRLIKSKQGQGKHANAYKSTLASLRRFGGSTEIFLSDFSPLFLTRYSDYLTGCGMSDNTVAYYMRNLKTIYNRAVKERLIPVDYRPFSGFSISPRKTVKRAVDRKTLKILAAIDLSRRPHREIARDLFLFSFYLRGISLVDIVYMKHEDIQAGVIGYHRRKTGQYIRVSVNPRIEELIEKYRTDSPYIFPFLTTDDRAHTDYRNALNRINRNLKLLSKELELPMVLTTYVARHTWATQAKERGASVAVISEALGHTSEKTTRIYLKEFDSSIIDQVNDDVTNLTL